MKAIELAKHIINYAISIGKPVSNLQLQKILYFVDIYNIIHKDKRLITDKNFTAWKYGPVIIDVYKEFSNYGAYVISIEQKFDECDIIPDNIKQIYGFVDYLLNNFTPWQLVEESHKKNSPWSQTELNHTISDTLLKKYAMDKKCQE